MSIYGIYDKNNKEQCLRVGTVDEIARFFELTARGLGVVIRQGIYKKRYEVIYLYEEN